MDILFNGFFDSCSLDVVIIAVAVTVVVFISNFIFKDKIPKTAKAIAPFVLSFVSYIVCDMIRLGEFIVREDALKASFICASVSTILFATIIKIKRGEKLPVSAGVLLIESLLTDLIEKDNLQQTACEIHQIIVNGKNEPNLTNKVSDIIKRSTTGLEDSEAEFASIIIIQAVEALRGQNTK